MTFRTAPKEYIYSNFEFQVELGVLSHENNVETFLPGEMQVWQHLDQSKTRPRFKRGVPLEPKERAVQDGPKKAQETGRAM